jgi:hypothetical protein
VHGKTMPCGTLKIPTEAECRCPMTSGDIGSFKTVQNFFFPIEKSKTNEHELFGYEWYWMVRLHRW